MKFFFNTLLNFMVGVANIFLAPVNSLVVNALPSFTEWVSNFTQLINTYLGNGLAYIFSLLPPNTRTLVLLYITILIVCYTITFAIHVILKIIEVIKQIKIW